MLPHALGEKLCDPKYKIELSEITFLSASFTIIIFAWNKFLSMRLEEGSNWWNESFGKSWVSSQRFSDKIMLDEFSRFEFFTKSSVGNIILKFSQISLSSLKDLSVMLS